MYRIALYSLLLLLGMACSQLLPLAPYSGWINAANMVCLAYIMIEVGLEFVIDKQRLSSYGTDYLVAMTAAACPWLFCSLYFYWMLETPFTEALLIGRFAAPTSAGILFAMLAAAGLATTWLFKKARILAIFDDLDTILLMIPLQFMFTGIAWDSLYLVTIILALLAGAYYYLHRLHLPVSVPWLLLYSALLVGGIDQMHHHLEIHLEVLLPAFALGCMLYRPHQAEADEPLTYRRIDHCVKNAFMFLVGCSLPPLDLGMMTWGIAAAHVLALTLLSNLGKIFPTLCYREEASWRERLALSIAMFPRGEVGAGVLLLAAGYNLSGEAVMLGALSLALNLTLTGFFIWSVLAIAAVPVARK